MRSRKGLARIGGQQVLAWLRGVVLSILIAGGLALASAATAATTNTRVSLLQPASPTPVAVEEEVMRTLSGAWKVDKGFALFTLQVRPNGTFTFIREDVGVFDEVLRAEGTFTFARRQLHEPGTYAINLFSLYSVSSTFGADLLFDSRTAILTVMGDKLSLSFEDGSPLLLFRVVGGSSTQPPPVVVDPWTAIAGTWTDGGVDITFYPDGTVVIAGDESSAIGDWRWSDATHLRIDADRWGSVLWDVEITVQEGKADKMAVEASDGTTHLLERTSD